MNRQSSCANCGVQAYYRCSRCKKHRYCSKTCQLALWTHHKTECVLQLTPTPSETECPICFNTTDAAVATLACSHTFHVECLHNWTRVCTSEHRSSTCPLCRKQFVIPAKKLISKSGFIPPADDDPYIWGEDLGLLVSLL